ncbi:putative ubiquitinyl hydrolase 1 [Helianthus debilis subsp. tardiflorus]
MNATTPATDDHPTPPYSRDCSSSSTLSSISLESVTIERRGEYAAVLLVYPKGDSQALLGYILIYLQIMDPRGTSSTKWDCFASYRLTVVNLTDDSKSIHHDSRHRFSTKKKSHGWCDFTLSASILDAKSRFLVSDDCCVVITADIFDIE